mgnify:CR=1 FL=1
MIKGIGVDICDLRRLNHLDQLAKKILHVDEFSLYLSKGNDKAKREFVGGRFAVKEAFVKAAGYKSFKEICCLNDKMVNPILKMSLVMFLFLMKIIMQLPLLLLKIMILINKV